MRESEREREWEREDHAVEDEVMIRARNILLLFALCLFKTLQDRLKMKKEKESEREIRWEREREEWIRDTIWHDRVESPYSNMACFRTVMVCLCEV